MSSQKTHPFFGLGLLGNKVKCPIKRGANIHLAADTCFTLKNLAMISERVHHNHHVGMKKPKSQEGVGSMTTVEREIILKKNGEPT